MCLCKGKQKKFIDYSCYVREKFLKLVFVVIDKSSYETSMTSKIACRGVLPRIEGIKAASILEASHISVQLFGEYKSLQLYPAFIQYN